MRFKTILLGKEVAKSENGFSGKGSWNLFKCFYQDKDNYAEFYLNLNEIDGIGEIVRKSTDYAPILEEAFGREMNNLDKIRADEAKVDELEQGEVSADYPIGGMLENYDIERERNL
jgi:hypothetical protein